MYKVRKLFRVPVGHRLSKHQGLCNNLHGHNLKIEVQIRSETLNKNDMVIDFHDLKKIVNDILEPFDHCTILNSQDLYYMNFLKEQGSKFWVLDVDMEFDIDPTAEFLAEHFYKEIDLHLGFEKIYESISVDFVRVWENDDGMAEYSEE